MEPKPGVKSSEFWLTAVVNITGAILAILAARGLVSAEEADLWVTLIQAVAVAVIPLALAIVNKSYIDNRKEIKVAALMGQQK